MVCTLERSSPLLCKGQVQERPPQSIRGEVKQKTFPGSCLDAETEWLWALSHVQVKVTLSCKGGHAQETLPGIKRLFWFIRKRLGFATVPIPQIQTSSSEKGKSAFLQRLTGIYATLAPVFREKMLPRPPDQTLLPTTDRQRPPLRPAPLLGCLWRRCHQYFAWDNQSLSPLSDPGRTLGIQDFLSFGFASG